MADNVLPTSNMDQFRDQLNRPNQHLSNFGVPISSGDSKIAKIAKNLVLSFSVDSSGCGHIRNIFWMTYLNAVYARENRLRTCVMPSFNYNHELLMQSRTLFFPRTMSQNLMMAVKKYKDLQPKYGYKMVYDIDDFIWNDNSSKADVGEKIPEYNFGSKNIPQDSIDATITIMAMMDTICVSTNFLSDYIKNKLRLGYKNIVVLPNCVNKHFYGPNKKIPIKEKLVMPKFIYTGSPTHYSNTDRLLGDFDCPFREFIIKNVIDNKIKFLCMGGLPWFFEKIKNKIDVVPWVNSYEYHIPILEYAPDFGIGPLVPNYFNYSKSSIKAIETYAYNALFMGSTFTNGKPSPYDDCFAKVPDNWTQEKIDDIVFNNLVYPENYNRIISNQRKYLDDNGCWLESDKYTNRLVKIF